MSLGLQICCIAVLIITTADVALPFAILRPRSLLREGFFKSNDHEKWRRPGNSCTAAGSRGDLGQAGLQGGGGGESREDAKLRKAGLRKRHVELLDGSKLFVVEATKTSDMVEEWIENQMAAVTVPNLLPLHVGMEHVQHTYPSDQNGIAWLSNVITEENEKNHPFRHYLLPRQTHTVLLPASAIADPPPRRLGMRIQ